MFLTENDFVLTVDEHARLFVLVARFDVVIVRVVHAGVECDRLTVHLNGTEAALKLQMVMTRFEMMQLSTALREERVVRWNVAEVILPVRVQG